MNIDDMRLCSGRLTSRLLPLLVCFGLSLLSASVWADDFIRLRKQLNAEIEDDVRATSHYIGKGSLNEQVMEAMAIVPRHAFVPPGQQPYAYENRPLSIGHGQTISQPYIVALMTDLLDVDPDDVVLEVGTGSGYQAAVLGVLVKAVYSIEIVKPLEQQARRRLKRLGFDNVAVRQGDGYYGWEEKAPFDAIIVTAAAGHIPPPLVQQLKPGGKMAIPVGAPFSIQQLMLVEKGEDGKVRTRQVLPVRFVPLTGDR